MLFRRLMTLILLLSATLFLTSCGKAHETDSQVTVFGGAIASGNLPVVRILLPRGECSAIFVSQKSALTAAHCFSGGGSQATYAGVQGQVVAIGRGGPEDLAVLHFPKPVARTIARLGTTRPQRGAIGTIAGYGCTQRLMGQTDGLLRIASVELSGTSQQGLLTSTWGNTGACNGDSGGGLFVNNYLVGITSSVRVMSQADSTGRQITFFETTWVDLNSYTSRMLLQLAVRQGASIPGFRNQ